MAESAVQSVDRAARILELLAQSPTLGVGEVAAHLGVHASTASRLLSALAAHGLVEALPGRGGYRLGFALVGLASSVAARLDLSQAAQATCDAVAQEVGLTANVAVRDDVWAVNVSQAMGPSALAPRHYVGLRTPGHATSSGKLLIALAADEVLEDLLARDLELFTAATITDPAALRSEIERIRQRGWATSDEEWEPGITAVAVPLLQPDGRVEAALTVTAPSRQLPPERFADIASAMARHAAGAGRWVTPPSAAPDGASHLR